MLPPQADPRVVVLQDPVEGRARLRHPEGPHLAQADAVAPSLAGEDEARRRCRSASRSRSMTKRFSRSPRPQRTRRPSSSSSPSAPTIDSFDHAAGDAEAPGAPRRARGPRCRSARWPARSRRASAALPTGRTSTSGRRRPPRRLCSASRNVTRPPWRTKRTLSPAARSSSEVPSRLPSRARNRRGAEVDGMRGLALLGCGRSGRPPDVPRNSADTRPGGRATRAARARHRRWPARA